MPRACYATASRPCWRSRFPTARRASPRTTTRCGRSGTPTRSSSQNRPREVSHDHHHRRRYACPGCAHTNHGALVGNATIRIKTVRIPKPLIARPEKCAECRSPLGDEPDRTVIRPEDVPKVEDARQKLQERNRRRAGRGAA